MCTVGGTVMPRSYKNNLRRHRAKLKRLIAKDEDFDYSFLHRLTVQKLRNMYEYYVNGVNVHMTDEHRRTVINSLKEALDTAERINSEASPDKSGLYKKFYTYIGENITMWWD